MTIEEMTLEVNKLENYYNKNLSEDEMKIWFDNLKDLSIKRFQYIIASLYKKCKYMPKLSEVWDIHKELPYVEEKKEVNIANCTTCNNTGFVPYMKNNYQYIAVCADCNRKQKDKNFTVSSNEVKIDRTSNITKKELEETVAYLKASNLMTSKLLECARNYYKKLGG